jgi:hypothetical protein
MVPISTLSTADQRSVVWSPNMGTHTNPASNAPAIAPAVFAA